MTQSIVVLLLTEMEPTDFWFPWFTSLIYRLKQHRSKLELRVWPESGVPEEVDIVLTWCPPLGVLRTFPNLKLILSLGAGADYILQDPDLPPEVPISRLVPQQLASQMTEYVMQAILAFKGRRVEYQKLQQLSCWEPLPTLRTDRFMVGILGLGAIGAKVARTLAAVDLLVRGWSRHSKQIKGVDCFFGPEQFEVFLSKCAVLVNLLPLTPTTEGILCEKTFAALPQGAYLINVGRGHHLIEADLLTVLDSGQIAGACLDVFKTEPLPKEHPFWSHPKIIVTPHIAAVSEIDDVVEYILEAIDLLKIGTLRYEIDRNQGY